MPAPPTALRLLAAACLPAGLAACGTAGGDGACAALAAGTWVTSGTCFDHEMEAEVSVSSDGCSFTFSNWSMDMDMPVGGTVDGSDFTLSGAGWEGCSGTVAEDGTSLTGSCPDEACAFSMGLQ